MPKVDFGITPPLMNAAGSLGFAPDRKAALDWRRLGAFVTNPFSLGERSPAQGTRFLPFAGGFLLHTGYPNPGLRQGIRCYAAAWKRSSQPVIVHILGQSPAEAAETVQRLEGMENVIGVELGLPPGIDEHGTRALVQAALGEMLLIIRLPFEQALALAPVALEAGAAAVSLGAPRGALPGPDGKLVEGRLYGPAVFPQALHMVRSLARLEIPLIGGGGVYRETDVQAMLEAGASAVQIDAAWWKDAPRAVEIGGKR